MGYFVKKNIIGSEGLVIPSGGTAERPITPIKGALRFNNDTNSLEYFNGSAFVTIAKAGNSTVDVHNFVTDGVNDTYILPWNDITDERSLVFLNGIHQTPGPTEHYVIDNVGGNVSIIFQSVPPSNLPVTVIHGMFSTLVSDSEIFDVPNL